MTGLAQVSGRNALDWDTKLELDACYAEDITFIGDIKILLKTLKKVIKRDGAIADKKENFLDIERLNKLKQ
jgi:lipopolysaccharide/colanic/teichoic acid biosynthesis glycosyltransferase